MVDIDASVNSFATQTILPEGATATLLIRAEYIERPVFIDVDISPAAAATRPVLSSTRVELNGDRSSATITVFLPNNVDAQTVNKHIDVSFGSDSKVYFNPPSLRLTVPPNDLSMIATSVRLDMAGQHEDITLNIDGLQLSLIHI